MNRPGPFTDETVLNFGVHSGKRFIDIPGSWFIWYADQPWAKNQRLLDYIKENREAFKLEGGRK